MDASDLSGSSVEEVHEGGRRDTGDLEDYEEKPGPPIAANSAVQEI